MFDRSKSCGSVGNMRTDGLVKKLYIIITTVILMTVTVVISIQYCITTNRISCILDTIPQMVMMMIRARSFCVLLSSKHHIRAPTMITASINIIIDTGLHPVHLSSSSMLCQIHSGTHHLANLVYWTTSSWNSLITPIESSNV